MSNFKGQASFLTKKLKNETKRKKIKYERIYCEYARHDMSYFSLGSLRSQHYRFILSPMATCSQATVNMLCCKGVSWQ